MPVPYPRNTIWYVEASSADGSDRMCGSAVAIWLQKVGQPPTRRKYLLTCAHVVRGTVPGSSARDHEAGFGPVLPNIEVWGPDTGYSPDSKFQATLATDIKMLREGVVPEEERSNAADDWIVLKVSSSQAGLAMDFVQEWADADAGELLVYGYPGGKKSFMQGKVVPSLSDDLAFHDHYHGVLRLVGTETRAGMSGGGVFDVQHRLVGLHRSRADDILQCHAVSSAAILEQLAAAGYQPVSVVRRGVELDRRAVLGAGTVGVAAAAIGCFWWLQTRPCIRIGIKPFVGYSPLKVISELGLCTGMSLEFTNVNTVSQMKEGVKHGRLDVGLWLSCTHGLFCAEETPVRARVVLKMDDSRQGDGILVRESIQELSDLQGARIAYQKHDAGEYLFRELCRQNGIEFSSLSHASDHTPASEAAHAFLVDKDVSAASTYEPHLGEILRETGIKPRWTAENLAPFGIVDVLAVDEEYLAANPGEVRALIDGWYQAVALIKGKDSAALEAAVNFIRTHVDDYSPDALLADIQPDVIPLADAAENCRYFRRVRGTSIFKQDYEHGQEVFRESVLHPLEFSRADGSQDFLRC